MKRKSKRKAGPIKKLIFVAGLGLFLLLAASVILSKTHKPQKLPVTVATVPDVLEPVIAQPEPVRPVIPETLPEKPLAEKKPKQTLWQENAVPSNAHGKIRIALVFDDMGLDVKDTRRAINLHGPFTMSFLPYADNLPQQTKMAHAHGHELMLHMPMQPIGHENPGPNALTVNLSHDEIQARLEKALTRFDGMVGMNNHMGSRFTQDEGDMQAVMAVLKEHGLLFLDSVTIGSSKAYKAAQESSVPSLKRDVFLDDTDSPAMIQHQLNVLETTASRHGSAIAIGHPRPNTLNAVAAWLPTLQSKKH